MLFTDNETNTAASSARRTAPYTKDGINDYIVDGQRDRAESGEDRHQGRRSLLVDDRRGVIAGGSASTVRHKPRRGEPGRHQPFGAEFDTVMRERQREADDFYASIIPPSLDPDSANVMRQALAGMLWSKQFYYYDVDRWLGEHGADPFKPLRMPPRNEQWHHMYNANILSMPDKWEYPWFAAWDLAFHVLALTLVDPDFGKQQLDVILGERYLHPNGQLPAYKNTASALRSVTYCSACATM